MKGLAEIITDTVTDRETRIRQGKVVSIQTGPPRSLTVDVSGVSYSGIRVMDHVDPTVNEGIWMLDMGIGKWLAFGSNSAAQTRTGYVKTIGDAMTGGLTMNFSGESVKFLTSGQYMSWFSGATRSGYLQGNGASGMTLNSETAALTLIGVGGLNLSPFTINGYSGSTTSGANTIALRDGNGYIVGNYINMVANVVSGFPPYFAGQGGDNFMRWYDKAGAFLVSSVQGNSNMGVSWANAAVIANVGFGNASCALHCGGVAPQLYSSNGFGNNVYCRDSVGNSASANMIAASHPIDSSKRWKKNINPWPLPSGGAASPRATDTVGQLRPVSFQRKDYIDEEVPNGRRLKAYIRLNEFKKNRDLPPYQLPQHNCGEHTCNGSADNPCVRALQQYRTKIGLIAEDVIDVLPEAVHLDIDRLPEAIDYAPITAVLVSAVQELTQRINILEGNTNG